MIKQKKIDKKIKNTKKGRGRRVKNNTIKKTNKR